ncbi:MAG: spore germination protein [Clostridia bacterium]|nr:spore germination protein [Clostridia bacterium]
MRQEEGKIKVDRDLEYNSRWMSHEIGVDQSFDAIRREFEIGGRKTVMFFMDGFVKDEVMERVLSRFSVLEPQDLRPHVFKNIFKKYLTYIEVETTDDLKKALDMLLAGPLILFIDGIEEAIVIDVREYPVRSPEEPDLERVVRGSRDGFVETIVFNTALIRRRVRDPKLRMEMLQVGTRSRSDVCLSYIKDIANPRLVASIKEKIQQINIDGIPMAEKSIEELIAPGNFWNPFPRVRYTERPDVAANHLLEGHLLVIVDTSPSVIILPVTLWHHLQHAEEFRQAPAVGVFMRWLRYIYVLLSVLIMPTWLLVATNPRFLPESLSFIGPTKSGHVGLFFQFLFAELGINLMRIAAVHTPDALTTSLGIIAAVLIGEIAVSVGLFTSEVVLYTAIAAVSIFATPSQELGQANTLVRVFLLLGVGLFGLPGFAAAMLSVIFLLLTTKSFGIPYLWPLVPLNLSALRDVLIRPPIPTQNLRLSILNPQDVKSQTTPGRAMAKPIPSEDGEDGGSNRSRKRKKRR